MRMKRSKNEPILPELREETFRELFCSSSDVLFDKIYIGETESPIPVLIFYCSGLADISLTERRKFRKVKQNDAIG